MTCADGSQVGVVAAALLIHLVYQDLGCGPRCDSSDISGFESTGGYGLL